MHPREIRSSFLKYFEKHGHRVVPSSPLLPGDDPTLLFTVVKGEKGIPRDDEAYKRWLDFVPADHIGELGMADNFWAMGDTGPCGRCSEIYVDRGAGIPGSGDFITDVESGSERFVEIWNNVFMEFERDDKGTLTP